MSFCLGIFELVRGLSFAGCLRAGAYRMRTRFAAPLRLFRSGRRRDGCRLGRAALAREAVDLDAPDARALDDPGAERDGRPRGQVLHDLGEAEDLVLAARDRVDTARAHDAAEGEGVLAGVRAGDDAVLAVHLDGDRHPVSAASAERLALAALGGGMEPEGEMRGTAARVRASGRVLGVPFVAEAHGHDEHALPIRGADAHGPARLHDRLELVDIGDLAFV